MPNFVFLNSNQQPPSFCYGGIPGMHGKPGLLGHQVVMVVMVVTEPKVLRAAWGGLDPMDLLVSMERMVPKENLESRALPAKRGSVERVERVPGTPNVMAYKNWKECAWNYLNDDKDNGLIRVNFRFPIATDICNNTVR